MIGLDMSRLQRWTRLSGSMHTPGRWARNFDTF